MPSTTRPNAAWISAQAARFTDVARAGGGKCRILVRDRDTKYGAAFDTALRAEGVTPLQLPYRAPNMNAHVERMIQTFQVECLDRFIVFGTAHLDHLVEQFVQHYNYERPHSGIGHRTPCGLQGTKECEPLGEVASSSRLGGTLRHYFRKAA